MQLHLGEQVKVLRRQNNRTQEELARALGVTAQAVSRWESGIGYPDMEYLPGLANYFHVSIDELFGYQNDREQKMEQILKKSRAPLTSDPPTVHQLDEAIAVLRAGLEEFPDAPALLYELAETLDSRGVLQIKTSRDDFYIQYDHAANAQNADLQEAMERFEQVLSTGYRQRDTVASLIFLCGITGAFDRGEELARQQPALAESRELLLTLATDGERKKQYQGNAILALLRELDQLLIFAVFNKISLRQSEKGLRIYQALIELHEALYEEGESGGSHAVLRDLNLFAAVLATKISEDTAAHAHLEHSFEHQRALEEYRRGERTVTATLFSGSDDPDWRLTEQAWRQMLERLPDRFTYAFITDSAYAHYFDPS